MGPAYFVIEDESPEAGRYAAQPATVGPWSPDLQHGGPPSALLVDAAERLVSAETGRAGLIAARLAAEFVGPVPAAEVTTTARVVRQARSGVLVEATLTAADRPCLQARIWLIAGADTSVVAAPTDPLSVPAGPTGLDARFPYAESIDWRRIVGGLSVPGPGVAWARPRLSVVAGRIPSGLQLAALVGDSASGISAALAWQSWSFVNVDLDVHLARPVSGDWLRLDAETQLGSHGFALARSTLSDVRGPVGATAQTLVVAPRRA